MTATVHTLDRTRPPSASSAASGPAKDYVPTVLLAPAVIFMTVVGFYPLLYSLYISLTNYNPTSGNASAWIGAANYTRAVTDGQFWHAMWLSGLFTALSVTLSLVIAVLLALLFNKNLPGFFAIRTIVLVPMLVTPIAVGIIWRIMFMPDLGVLNYMLGLFGIPGQSWLGQRWLAFASIVVVDVWEWTPFLFLIIFAGLRALPASPFESASIDGAGPLTIFFNITLPLLKPVMVIATLLRLIDAARTYDTVYILTRGGPDFATDLSSIYLQRVNFQFFNIGYGSALSLIMLVAILVVVLVFVKWSGFLKIVSEREPG